MTKFNKPKDFKLSKYPNFRKWVTTKKLNQMYGDYVKLRKSTKDKTFELYIKYLLFWNENRWMKKNQKTNKKWK